MMSLDAVSATRFTEQSDRLEAKMRKWHRAAAAIVLLSSVGRANVRKTHKNFPCLKAKLRGEKRGSGAKP